jgi:rhamnogalacturonyl hydrolase YesR
MPNIFKKHLFGLLFVVFLLPACSGTRPKATQFDAKKQMGIVQQHFRNALNTYTDLNKFPRSFRANGTLAPTTSDDWTSGFFPASLWYLYEYTKDESWKQAAQKWLVGLEREKNNKGTHDLGFMMYCPYGAAERLSPDPKYKEILVTSARSLATRFNPTVGSIKSWDTNRWKYPVIIDNMMNLGLLFWTTRATGDSTFYKMAVAHANTTMRNHFRPDFSSYHVIGYDPNTGAVVAKQTAQGFADESAWARGQSWGLYGFTETYRNTRNPQYLEQAQKIADFILKNPNLPSDKVPYWDYNAPNIPNEERDASAAAIMASALLELSEYVPSKRDLYVNTAEQILISLSSPAFQAEPGTNGDLVLKHSVGSKPGKSELDVPLVYADYYYIEALLRYIKIKK